jgi:hypothetical protein
MTNEERDLISQFVARVGGNPGGGGVFARSVPSTQPNLPPIDPEADRFIAEQFASHPEARYRVTQMAVVQEAALAEAASRMQKMQAELDQARQQMQQMQQSAPAGQQQSRGFLGSLFGGAAASAPPPPPPHSPWNQGPAQPQYAPQPQPYAPQYPPNTQPGMFQRSGSGFLGSALTTAAGVAGGVVGANLLMDMFSGHGGGGGGFGGGGFGGGGFGGAPVEENTTVINNYGDNAGPPPVSSDWGNATQGGPSDGGFADNSGWDNSAQDSSGFDDTST